jgi:integrating conjugative element protein (TIGR03749 family)
MRHWLILLTLVLSNVASANTIAWDRKPILVNLPVGEEKIIIFQESFELGIDRGHLNEEILNIDNIEGALYLKANRELSAKSRIYVKLKSGNIVLLDLIANQMGDASTIHVNHKSQETEEKKSKHRLSAYQELIRYGASQLYAPDRLVEVNSKMVRVPMRTTQLVSLVPGHFVYSMPISQWSDGDLYVTAVLVRNKTNAKQKISLKNIKGNWAAASIYPNAILSDAHSSKNSTTVFLVSSVPFNQAIEG